MEIGYILAIIFGVIWLVFKIIDIEKARKADLQKHEQAKSDDDYNNLIIK